MCAVAAEVLRGCWFLTWFLPCFCCRYADMLTPYMNSVPAVIAKASAIHNPIIYAITHPKYRYVPAAAPGGADALLESPVLLASV